MLKIIAAWTRNHHGRKQPFSVKGMRLCGVCTPFQTSHSLREVALCVHNRHEL